MEASYTLSLLDDSFRFFSSSFLTFFFIRRVLVLVDFRGFIKRVCYCFCALVVPFEAFVSTSVSFGVRVLRDLPEDLLYCFVEDLFRCFT